MEKLKKINFRQLGASLVVGLSLATGSIACKDKNSPAINNDKVVSDSAQGPSESGGGDPNKILVDGMYMTLEEAILKAHMNALSYIQSYKETFAVFYLFKDEVEDSPFTKMIQESPKLSALLDIDMIIKLGMELNGGDKLEKALSELETPLILKDKPCIDKFAKEGDNERAASATYDGKICFSLKKFAETTEFNQVAQTVRSMLMHELAHKAGITDEKQAQSMEAMFWLLGDKVHYSSKTSNDLEYQFNPSISNVEIAIGDFKNLIGRNQNSVEYYESYLSSDLFYIALEAREDVNVSSESLKTFWKTAWIESYAGREDNLNYGLESLLDVFTQRKTDLLRELELIDDLPQPILEFFRLKQENYLNLKNKLYDLKLESRRKIFSDFRNSLDLEFDFYELIEDDEYELQIASESKGILRAITAFSRYIDSVVSEYVDPSYSSSTIERFKSNKGLDVCSYLLYNAGSDEPFAKLINDFCEGSSLSKGLEYTENEMIDFAVAGAEYLVKLVKAESKRIVKAQLNYEIYECAFLNSDRCAHYEPKNERANLSDELKLNIKRYKTLKSLKRAPSLGMVQLKYDGDLDKALKDYQKLPENLPAAGQID